MKKEITARIIIHMDDQYIPLDNFTEAERKHISTVVNERALKSIGYVKDKTA